MVYIQKSTFVFIMGFLLVSNWKYLEQNIIFTHQYFAEMFKDITSKKGFWGYHLNKMLKSHRHLISEVRKADKNGFLNSALP